MAAEVINHVNGFDVYETQKGFFAKDIRDGNPVFYHVDYNKVIDWCKHPNYLHQWHT